MLPVASLHVTVNRMNELRSVDLLFGALYNHGQCCGFTLPRTGPCLLALGFLHQILETLIIESDSGKRK